MNILIAGGTGFVGQAVTKELHKQGHHIYILTRNPKNYGDTEKITYLPYDTHKLPIIQAVINLAGDTLYLATGQRPKKKQFY